MRYSEIYSVCLYATLFIEVTMKHTSNMIREYIIYKQLCLHVKVENALFIQVNLSFVSLRD